VTLRSPTPSLPVLTAPVFTVLIALVLLSADQETSAAEFVAPYVDTVKEDVELILDLAEVTAEDYLIDLGSGDGRFVIAAAKRGAMAHGVELEPQLVKLATEKAKSAGVADKAVFVEGDIFAADISHASVVTLYLFPEANLQLRPKLLAELRPGTKVVSNSFTMGDWEPDNHAQGRTSGGALLWFIPADVRGAWQIDVGSERFAINLEQEFQRVRSADAPNRLKLTAITLSGETIRFSAQSTQASYLFDGRVQGDSITGIAHVVDAAQKQTLPWEARRLSSERPIR